MDFNVSMLGMGDAVCAAWMAAGLIDAGETCRFNAGGNKAILQLFGMDTSLETGGVDIGGDLDKDCGEPYKVELRIGGGPIPRPTLWASTLNIKAPPRRPDARLTEADAAAAISLWGDTADKKRVMLFPRSVWANRIWPKVHWLQLAWKLEAAGYHTLALDSTDTHLKKFPRWACGYSWATIAGLMMQSDLVMGNDSGPAHLSGTLNIPTLGVLGAMDPRTIWGHMPSVQFIRTDRIGCVGCHFKHERGFNDLCSDGCEALFILSADEVFEKARTLL